MGPRCSAEARTDPRPRARREGRRTDHRPPTTDDRRPRYFGHGDAGSGEARGRGEGGQGRQEKQGGEQQFPPQHQERRPGIESRMTPEPFVTWSA